MHGLETPPRDPQHIIAWTIGIVIGAYALAILVFKAWEALQ